MALVPLQRKKLRGRTQACTRSLKWRNSVPHRMRRKGEFQRLGSKVLALDPGPPFLRSLLLSGIALLTSGLPGFVAQFGRWSRSCPCLEDLEDRGATVWLLQPPGLGDWNGESSSPLSPSKPPLPGCPIPKAQHQRMSLPPEAQPFSRRGTGPHHCEEAQPELSTGHHPSLSSSRHSESASLPHQWTLGLSSLHWGDP